MRQNDVVNMSHAILNLYVKPEDIIIDATIGNGRDTLYLAKLAKHVHAFDIQKLALSHTKKLLDEHHISNVTLHHRSHEMITSIVSDFKGVIFNLGYLPTGDKTITTTKDTTIQAIHTLLPHLKSDGFILLVVYPGHPEGRIESEAIEAYLHTIDTKDFSIMKTNMPFHPNNPPYILFIRKR